MIIGLPAIASAIGPEATLLMCSLTVWKHSSACLRYGSQERNDFVEFQWIITSALFYGLVPDAGTAFHQYFGLGSLSLVWLDIGTAG